MLVLVLLGPQADVYTVCLVVSAPGRPGPGLAWLEKLVFARVGLT
ncbi:MAG: hypothetical protein M0005_06500 [Actinomycetota bacterium]|jgi:hypothetical protein|nr:hypothetical protein [Actinomycetota bacterium]